MPQALLAFEKIILPQNQALPKDGDAIFMTSETAKAMGMEVVEPLLLLQKI